MTAPTCPTCDKPGVLLPQYVGGRGYVSYWVCPTVLGESEASHRLMIRETRPLEGCEDEGREG